MDLTLTPEERDLLIWLLHNAPVSGPLDAVTEIVERVRVLLVKLEAPGAE